MTYEDGPLSLPTPYCNIVHYVCTLFPMSSLRKSPYDSDCTLQVAAELSKVGGVSKLLVAEDAALEGLLPERVAPVLLAAQKQFNFSHIIGKQQLALARLQTTLCSVLCAHLTGSLYQ